MSEEKMKQFTVVRCADGKVINFRTKDGRIVVGAVVTKVPVGTRAALFKSGEASSILTMEVAFGPGRAEELVRGMMIRLASAIGKNGRKNANRAAKAVKEVA